MISTRRQGDASEKQTGRRLARVFFLHSRTPRRNTPCPGVAQHTLMRIDCIVMLRTARRRKQQTKKKKQYLYITANKSGTTPNLRGMGSRITITEDTHHCVSTLVASFGGLSRRHLVRIAPPDIISSRSTATQLHDTGVAMHHALPNAFVHKQAKKKTHPQAHTQKNAASEAIDCARQYSAWSKKQHPRQI